MSYFVAYFYSFINIDCTFINSVKHSHEGLVLKRLHLTKNRLFSVVVSSFIYVSRCLTGESATARCLFEQFCHIDLLNLSLVKLISSRFLPMVTVHPKIKNIYISSYL